MSEEWRYRLEEREAIMIDSDVSDATRKAKQETRKHWEGVLPPEAWGMSCGRGWVSDSRFGSGQVIPRTRRK
jgi:hypothetical protein